MKQTPWKKGITISIVIFLLCLLYAFIRYNIIRNVSLDQLPLYITNKAVALSATIIIGFSFALGPLARFFPNAFVKHLPLRKTLGLIGFAVATQHAIMSLVLFDKSNYPRFFLESGKLTLAGESVMLFGVLAFLIFSVVAIVGIPSIEEKLDEKDWLSILRLGYVAYFLVLLHVALMGYRGWFNADSWQYGFASITLITSLFIVLVFILRFLTVLFPRKST